MFYKAYIMPQSLVTDTYLVQLKEKRKHYFCFKGFLNEYKLWFR